MRLLDTNVEQGLCVHDFEADAAPQYAILSHTWENEEVLFADVRDGAYQHKAGFKKIQGACDQARKDECEYIWIDTCCIDKSSSVELSEAINSMWTYYENAQRCYAYLPDVECADTTELTDAAFEWPLWVPKVPEDLAKARWFTRGWTLQELLAPQDPVFMDVNWQMLGTRAQLAENISIITGIEVKFLDHSSPLDSASIAKRMSWASRRQTRRLEDVAYSLMGIFSVNMPMLYGEGKRAFFRLQTAIMAQSDDQSMFAWVTDGEPGTGSLFGPPSDFHGLFADHPRDFATSGSSSPYTDFESRKPYSMTNRGLSIELPLSRFSSDSRDLFEAVLQCSPLDKNEGFLTISLMKVPGTVDQFARVWCSQVGATSKRGTPTMVYVKQKPTQSIADAGIYPYHLFVLSTSKSQTENYFNGYRIEATVPFKPSVEFVHPKYSYVRPTLPWVASDVNRAFQIQRSARQMTVALILRQSSKLVERRPDVAILLGSITDTEVGFDVYEMPAWKPDLPSPGLLQDHFEPHPMGTVLVVGCWKFTVTTTVQVEGAQKIYSVAIFVAKTTEG